MVNYNPSDFTDIDEEFNEYALIKKTDLYEIITFYKQQGLVFPYYMYSTAGRTLVKNGKGMKQPKYNSEQVQEILKDLKVMSIRKVAAKYKSSTKTIQAIKNGTYIPRNTPIKSNL